MFVQTEITPNPNSLKFLPGKKVSNDIPIEITDKNGSNNELLNDVGAIVIPGKFTLAFSLAPEFYRIVYKKNPRKMFSTFSDDGKFSHLIADTIWGELQN